MSITCGRVGIDCQIAISLLSFLCLLSMSFFVVSVFLLIPVLVSLLLRLLVLTLLLQLLVLSLLIQLFMTLLFIDTLIVPFILQLQMMLIGV